MIYEIRTYTLRPGSTAEAEARWGEAYQYRKDFSAIAAFFHTDVGPLNEIIQIWPYEDFADRARVRAEVAKETRWPPDLSEFIVNQKVEVLTPFPFAPAWTPGKVGPLYEMRQYSYRAGTLRDIMASWEAALPTRMEFSSPVMLGNIEFGPTVNSFIHLWAYKSMEERNAVRAGANASGKWPPTGGRDRYLTQANKLLAPAVFSPAQ